MANPKSEFTYVEEQLLANHHYSIHGRLATCSPNGEGESYIRKLCAGTYQCTWTHQNLGHAPSPASTLEQAITKSQKGFDHGFIELPVKGVIVKSGILSSVTEVNRAFESGGFRINKEKYDDPKELLERGDYWNGFFNIRDFVAFMREELTDRILVIQYGKKHGKIVRVDGDKVTCLLGT